MRTRRSRGAGWLAAAAAVFTAGAAAAELPVSFSTVALSGDAAPGTPAGVTFAFFGGPTLANDGEVFFSAVLVGPGLNASNADGLWGPDETGTFGLLARTGSQAPGATAGAIFDSFSFGAASNFETSREGHVAFAAFLVQGPAGVTAADDAGLWGPDANGALTLLAREGDQPPGTVGGASYSGFTASAVQVSSNGRVAMRASVLGDEAGIWVTDATGSFVPMVRTGQPAPGAPTLVLDRVLSRPLLNAAGELAFWGSFEVGTGGVTFDDDGALFGPDGVHPVTLLVRENEPAPSEPNGVHMQFQQPALNEQGDVAFWGSIRCLPTCPGAGSFSSGTWTPAPAGGFQVVALEGSQAAGLPPGAVYGSPGTPRLTEDGEVVIVDHLEIGPGGVTSDDDSAIWIGSAAGSLRLVVREGDPIPFLLPASTFGPIAEVASNRSGEIALVSDLDHNPGGEGLGLYLASAGGPPRAVIRAGDTLEVAPGDIRTVMLLRAAPRNIDSGRRMLNDLGQVAFSATFSNGTSGVFIATPTQNIPSLPWTATVAAALLLLAVALSAPRLRNALNG